MTETADIITANESLQVIITKVWSVSLSLHPSPSVYPSLHLSNSHSYPPRLYHTKHQRSGRLELSGFFINDLCGFIYSADENSPLIMQLTITGQCVWTVHYDVNYINGCRVRFRTALMLFDDKITIYYLSSSSLERSYSIWDNDIL